jgi:hypothetical protein
MTELDRVNRAEDRKRDARPACASVLAAVASALLAAPITAQVTVGQRVVNITNGNTEGTYERHYGEPQWVSLEAIGRGEAPPHTALRTRGLLTVTHADPFNRASPLRYTLESADQQRSDRATLGICPVPDVADKFNFEAESLRFHEVEVVETLEPQAADQCKDGQGGFAFWSYSLADASPKDARSDLTSVHALLGNVEKFRGKTVRVPGQFRGRNLFGDVPQTEMLADGWLIKDGDNLWIVGRPPKGKGFALDPTSKAEGKWWVEVVGVPEVRNGVVVLHAREVILSGSRRP